MAGYIIMTIGVMFVLIIGVMAGFGGGREDGRLKWIEICEEAKSKEVKLESCGYYKWELTK